MSGKHLEGIYMRHQNCDCHLNNIDLSVLLRTYFEHTNCDTRGIRLVSDNCFERWKNMTATVTRFNITLSYQTASNVYTRDSALRLQDAICSRVGS